MSSTTHSSSMFLRLLIARPIVKDRLKLTLIVINGRKYARRAAESNNQHFGNWLVSNGLTW